MITLAHIMLAPPDVARTMYTSGWSGRDLALKVKSHLGLYIPVKTIPVYNKSGRDAAEEIFDLTNNPSREQERDDLYGPIRSVSVGDVVQVGQQKFLCLSMGWQELD